MVSFRHIPVRLPTLAIRKTLMPLERTISFRLGLFNSFQWSRSHISVPVSGWINWLVTQITTSVIGDQALGGTCQQIYTWYLSSNFSHDEKDVRSSLFISSFLFRYIALRHLLHVRRSVKRAETLTSMSAHDSDCNWKRSTSGYVLFLFQGTGISLRYSNIEFRLGKRVCFFVIWVSYFHSRGWWL